MSVEVPYKIEIVSDYKTIPHRNLRPPNEHKLFVESFGMKFTVTGYYLDGRKEILFETSSEEEAWDYMKRFWENIGEQTKCQ